MHKIELMIDIGSSNITVFKKDAGIVLKEPTVVVVSNEKSKTSFEGAGSDAKALLAKSDNLQVIYPIKEGTIDHENGAVYLFGELFKKIVGAKPLVRPRIAVLAAVSCGLTNAEKQDIERVLLSAGASDVTIIESPIAVSQNFSDAGSFIVDIGASKTEIAVVIPTGIAAGCTIDIGGNEINKLINDYITDEHRVAVQMHNIEKLKINIASMFDNDASAATMSGRSIIDSKPKSVKVSASELMVAIRPAFDKIAEVIETMTFNIPDKYAEEIFNNGIYLCGGTSLITGLETYFSNKLLIKVNRIDDPENAVVNGGQTFFYNKDRLASMLNIKNFN